MGPAATLRAYFDEYWNGRDPSAFDRYMHPDVEVLATFAGEPLGRADLFAMSESFRAMFDDGDIHLEDVIESGDLASAVIVVDGTVPETGRQVRFRGLITAEVREGRIVRDISRFDTQEILIAAGRVDPFSRLSALAGASTV